MLVQQATEQTNAFFYTQSHLAALKSRFAASVEGMNEAVRATIGCLTHSPFTLRWVCEDAAI